MALTQKTILPLKYGYFSIAYHKSEEGACVSISHGDLTRGLPVVRLHSSCLFGESFHGLDCDCAAQLSSTLKLIVKNGSGTVVYSYAEGRGIGLERKIQALELQRTRGLNTVEAFAELGFPPDLRTYEKEVMALKELGVAKKIKVASQNPSKLSVLKKAGFTVVMQLHPEVQLNVHNVKELLTKKTVLGYNIQQDLGDASLTVSSV